MFESLKGTFDTNFSERGELGASISVWRDGEEVFSLAEGYTSRDKGEPWAKDTLVPVYSATKGPAAATVLLVLDQEGLSLNTNIRDVWAEFPLEKATIGDLMSHRCGLAALDGKVDLWEFDEVIEAIEKQSPNWVFTEGHGYHPRTYGFLLDKVVRQISSRSLGLMWRELIADPLDIDFWIGLPESQNGRVATLYTGKMDKSDLDHEFYENLNKEGSLQRRAFSSPRGLQAVRDMNEPKAWAAGLPAMGGVGTASALAKFYQTALGNTYPEIFPYRLRELMSKRLSNGYDQTLMRPTAFSCGFMLDPLDENTAKISGLFGRVFKRRLVFHFSDNFLFVSFPSYVVCQAPSIRIVLNSRPFILLYGYWL